MRVRVEDAVAVLDVGKTHTKLSLIVRDGRVAANRTRANLIRRERSARYLDTEAIEIWLIASLGELAREANIVAIIPVAHGAAAAIVKGDRLVHPVLDYETPVPEEISRAYEA